MWNIEKSVTNELICKKEIEPQNRENGHVSMDMGKGRMR